jgi:hypothetical protein
MYINNSRTSYTDSRFPLRSSPELAGGSASGNNSSTGFGNSEGTGRNSMLQQIPSKPTDFPRNHPSVIQVHVDRI